MTNYDMFSAAGNRAVAQMVDKIVRDGEAGKLLRPDLEKAVSAGLTKVSAKYGEAWDTAVRDVVYGQIDRRLCEPQGWRRIYE